MRQRWEGVIAYGYRDNSPVQLGNKIVVLVNTWSPNCVKRNGGFGAAVMATKPIPEVNASNGSITVMVYGIEGCARDQKETTDYADGVMEHVESDLLSQLGAQ
jgi:hypothetical protein